MFQTGRSLRATLLALMLAAGGIGFMTAPLHAADSNTSEVSPSAVQMLQSFSDAFADIANKAQPAVVNVRTTREVSMGGLGFGDQDPFEEFRRFFGPEFDFRFQRPQRPNQPNTQKVQGIGSGVIVSADGTILTNNHVIADASEIIVTMNDRKEFTAELVGADPRSDLAVLKIKSESPLPFLDLGNSEKLRVGDWVIAVGNPLGFNNTVTAGIVSATGRANVGLTDFEDYIQTDAAINQGNSGGPLLNIRGEVIGINSAIATRTGSFSGIGLAIPSNMARSIMNQLIDSGKVSRGWLGVVIQDLNSELGRQFGTDNLNGALVGKVMPDSPAEKAGLRTGDIVRKVEGESVRDSGALRNRIAGMLPESSIKIDIERRGKPETVTMKIGQRPDDEGAAAGPSSQTAPAGVNLGFSVDNLSDEIAKQFGFDAKKDKGVVVTKVEPNSDAAMKGLKPGQLIEEVNQKAVENVNDFENTIKDHKDQDQHLLLVRDGDFSRFVVVKAAK